MRKKITPQLEVVADKVDVAVRLNDRPVLRVVEGEAAQLGAALLDADRALREARLNDRGRNGSGVLGPAA